MEYPARIIPLKDGSRLTLRSATVADAAEDMVFFRTLVEGSPYLLTTVEELGLSTLQSMVSNIRAAQESPTRVMLFGYVDGQQIASAAVSCLPRAKVCHRAEIGIGVLPEWWGKGVGTAMMNTMEQIALGWGVHQLELSYVEGNVRAYRLYARLGYQTYGAVPQGVLMPDGTYRDLVLMRKPLTK